MRYLCVLAMLVLGPQPTFGQHDLGAREQWQPQVADTDARLQQSVEIEILGRAAVPALELLSEKTEVSLGVAPENLTTVGERKLTIIAQGCALKDIMAQIPEALQECHWDVDASGEEPAYFLHRNAGVDKTMDWLSERASRRGREEQREKLVDRMEQARRVLQMSDEELAELEKTDLLLARSVRDPHSRDLLEILLSLPPEQAEQFQETGGLDIEYPKAPERLQEAVKRIAEWQIGRYSREQLPPGLKDWQDDLSHASITFQDRRVDHGWGVWLSLNIPEYTGYPTIHDIALHPRYCNLDEGQLCYTRLLVATGAAADEAAAFEMVKARDLEGFRVSNARREERHKREWREPTDPDLLQTIVVADEQFSDFAELRRFIAHETGLSVISDYFTLRAPYIPEDIRKGVPLWRLLYILGEDEFRGDLYLWEKAGKCLVFHRADWYALTEREVPEALIIASREKLHSQGELTLNDLAELAAALDSPSPGFPRDLQRAGLHGGFTRNLWALLLYASLSPEQLDVVRSPEGLAFADMTIAQRKQVIDRAAGIPRPLTRGQASQAAFHLVEEVKEAHGRRFATTDLQLRFGDQTDSAWVKSRLLEPEERSPTGSQ
ncbi:MAG: hypothetical protein JSV79_10695 [Armatimonadota bacterium]|nr:MAG: hypothetical protein JSV79_10695 [Armatimonadota bacterium]